jgi:hypothetical protein
VNYAREHRENDRNTAGGLAALTMGVLILTTPVWAGPPHTSQGENWVDLLQTELLLSGILLLGFGIFLLGRNIRGLINHEYALAPVEVVEED